MGEEKMAKALDLNEKSKVLDIGCGRGRIAYHMASSTGANVVGINIDNTQLQNAKEFAASSPYASQLSFKRANYNDPLPFDDETFDALYQVQVFTYAKDKKELCKELFRVMKPGAKFSYLDWVRLPAYNPE